MLCFFLLKSPEYTALGFSHHCECQHSNARIHFGDAFPETNSSHLKIDGWETILSFWEGLFSGARLGLGSVTLQETKQLFSKHALGIIN